ncbi:MAG: aminoacyltransferase [Candidatus Nanopelagicales bacterium]|jgi:lipid II:glycine glycyltransferase (peptidoglycan interpeptide bridge formation enzyme)|nr:aminoacyltransferase [Candidatus Nanopelagicales bacterium]
MPLTVARITPEQHLAHVRARATGSGIVSTLQVPAWGAVKADWRHESVGWFDEGALVGTGLVLYRQVPKLPRFLAYLPEGPDIDWLGEGPAARGLAGAPERAHPLADWLDPMLAHLRRAGAFAAKLGPPIWTRRWHAPTLKDAIAGGSATALRDLPPDETDGRALAAIDVLEALGWTQRPSSGAGFGDVQPRYVFQVPLADRAEEDLLRGFNQLWRRNIKKADKLGVQVHQGGAEDLAAFHRIYVETADRDRFHPRGLPYFQRMWSALRAEDPDRIRLYLATHDGELHAATLWARVNRHCWYTYGASTTAGRDLRPSNAIQWQMIRDAREAGCDTYDMRGITDTLDPADHLFGLLQFKVGTGGYAQEYAGEWDYAIRPALARAFEAYMRRR